jgi:signal transduction histidine kinase
MYDRLRFTDQFINPEYKNNKRAYYKARMLVNVSFLTSLFSLSYLIISALLGFERGVYMMLFDVVGFVGVAFLVRTKLNIGFLSNLYIAIGAVPIYTLIFYSGGISSPIMLWIIAAPILALLVANRGSAITWALVMLMGILVFNFIEVYDIKPESDLPEEFSDVATLTILIGLMLIIFIITLIFEKEKSEALLDTDKKNNELTKALNDLTKIKSWLTRSNKEINTKNEQLLAVQREIMEQAEQLRNLNEEKDNIIEVLAHDLKEPLGSMEGLIDLILKDNNPMSANQQECIDHIKKSVIKSKSLVSKILFSGEIENRKMKVKYEKVNISAVLQNSLDMFAKQASDKNIKLEKKSPKKDIHIVTDEVLVTQIFQNILSNSIKYSPKKSTVTVALERLEKNVKFEFVDQGPGIAEGELEKLFEKYSRLSNRPTNEESSSGLGLSLVKRYVDILEGQIWYENNNKKGANFILLLPIRSNN